MRSSFIQAVRHASIGMLQWVRADQGFSVIFFALSLAYVVPIWVPTVFPSTDLYAHIAIVAVMENAGNASHLHGQWFEWGALPYPNALFYLVAYLLSKLSNPILATNLVLSAYALAFPLCVHVFLKSFRRDRWLVLFSFPVIYNMNLISGFITFSLSMPFMFLAIGLSEAHFRNPSWKRGIAAGFVGVLVFVTHFFGAAIYCLLVGVQLLTHIRLCTRDGWTERLKTEGILLVRRAASLLPIIGLFANYLYNMFSASKGAVAKGASRLTFSYHNFDTKLYVLHDQTLNIFVDDRDALVVVLLGIVGLFAVANRRATHYATWIDGFRMELLALTLICCFFLFPAHMTDWAVIYPRLGTPIAVFLAGWAGVQAYRSTTQRWILLIVPLVAINFFHLSNLVERMRNYDQETSGAYRLLQRAPKQMRMLQQTEPQLMRSKYIRNIALYHVNQLYYALGGGITQDSFAKVPGPFVVKLKKGRTMSGVGWVPRWWANGWVRRNFDLVLFRGVHPPPARKDLKLLGKDGDWRLYRFQ